VLETAKGERLTFVRVAGNPFDDPETRKLVGHVFEAEGYASAASCASCGELGRRKVFPPPSA